MELRAAGLDASEIRVRLRATYSATRTWQLCRYLAERAPDAVRARALLAGAPAAPAPKRCSCAGKGCTAGGLHLVRPARLTSPMARVTGRGGFDVVSLYTEWGGG